MIERILSLAGGDEAAAHRDNLRAFRLALLMAVFAETLLKLLPHHPGTPGEPAVVFRAAAVLLGACLVLAWLRRWERAATVVACAALGLIYTLSFPLTANHQFLALVCMVLLASFDLGQEGERRLLLQALRWFTAIVLFYTGFQKLRYGLYFRGEFFAYQVAVGSRFMDFFQVFLPQEEIARLQAIGPPAAGSGPYRLHSLPFVVSANLAMFGEMLLALLLLIRRTRRVALVGALVLMLFIELGAREFVFGSIFAALLLLFARTELNRRLLPVFVGFYLLLLALRLAIAPRWFFL